MYIQAIKDLPYYLNPDSKTYDVNVIGALIDQGKVPENILPAGQRMPTKVDQYAVKDRNGRKYITFLIDNTAKRWVMPMPPETAFKKTDLKESEEIAIKDEKSGFFSTGNLKSLILSITAGLIVAYLLKVVIEKKL